VKLKVVVYQVSYQLQNGGQSDATYSYREPGTNTLISTFLGGFETTTICAVNGSVSAESAINVSELGSC
jgi:hypothetical protein